MPCTLPSGVAVRLDKLCISTTKYPLPYEETCGNNTCDCSNTINYLRMVHDTIHVVVETNHLGVLETHRVEHAKERH